MGERRGRFVAVRVRGRCNNSDQSHGRQSGRWWPSMSSPILSLRATPYSTPSLSPSRLTESQANCGWVDRVGGELRWFDLVCPFRLFFRLGRIGECCNVLPAFEPVAALETANPAIGSNHSATPATRSSPSLATSSPERPRHASSRDRGRG